MPGPPHFESASPRPLVLSHCATTVVASAPRPVLSSLVRSTLRRSISPARSDLSLSRRFKDAGGWSPSRAVADSRIVIAVSRGNVVPISPRAVKLSALLTRGWAILVLSLTCALVVGSPSRSEAQESAQHSTLRPGDSLRVRVWREPDLSGDFMVDEHGDLTLPRLGRQNVLNVPIDSIRARVQRAYAEFVREANVEITPLYRVRVAGAVRNPGLFTVNPTMSVGDVIGLAGGVSSVGKNDRVDLIRNGRRLPVSISDRVAELTMRSGDELFVPERRQIGRPVGLVLGAISTFASLYWVFHR